MSGLLMGDGRQGWMIDGEGTREWILLLLTRKEKRSRKLERRQIK